MKTTKLLLWTSESCFHININLFLKGKCGSLEFPSCHCYNLKLFLKLISDNVKFGRRKIVMCLYFLIKITYLETQKTMYCINPCI